METKDVSCAYSAHAPEDTLIDNDARPSSRRGRKTGKRKKNERAHLSVSKVEAARRPSPPDCAIKLLWRLEGGGNSTMATTLHKKTLIVDSFDDVNMQGKVQQKFF